MMILLREVQQHPRATPNRDCKIPVMNERVAFYLDVVGARPNLGRHIALTPRQDRR